MNSNRPSNFRHLTIDTNEAKESSNSLVEKTSENDEDLSSAYNTDFDHFKNAVTISAATTIPLLIDHLEGLDKPTQAEKADKILRELQALKKHFKLQRDKSVVSAVMDSVRKYVNPRMAKIYDTSIKPYPSVFFENITILPKLLPNFKEVLRYRDLDEKKDNNTENVKLIQPQLTNPLKSGIK